MRILFLDGKKNNYLLAHGYQRFGHFEQRGRQSDVWVNHLESTADVELVWCVKFPHHCSPVPSPLWSLDLIQFYIISSSTGSAFFCGDKKSFELELRACWPLPGCKEKPIKAQVDNISYIFVNQKKLSTVWTKESSSCIVTASPAKRPNELYCLLVTCFVSSPAS